MCVCIQTRCGYCHKAKRALAQAGLPLGTYTLIELDQRRVDEMTAIQAYLGTLTGATTVPSVFIGGAFVGGGTEVAQLGKAGMLTQRLQDAGALTSS
jgi:glutaredoxin 3